MLTCTASNYKNYSKNFDKKQLFSHLLERLPKEVNYAYTKRDLKFKRKDLNYKAIQKGKFLLYNSRDLITELVFDIDNISHLTIYDLDWIYQAFYKKFSLPLTWSCKTDRGVQFCISLNTFFKLSSKQEKLLKDFKNFVTDNWELLDKAGSGRLRGWWRNPLTQTEFRYYGNILTFEDIKEFLFRNKLTIKQQFKAKARQTQVKNQAKNTKARIIVGEPVIGNRNNFIFYNTMLNVNSKNFNKIIKIAENLNKKAEEPLKPEELKKIAKSVWKYNTEGKNYVYKNSKKAKWNIGVMGFKPMRNLSYKEFLEEKKRRQSMAGKRNAKIGKQNLIKAASNKAETTKQKVYQAIKELKEKNEKITILKIVELAKVSKNSASKYIKMAREEGIID